MRKVSLILGMLLCTPAVFSQGILEKILKGKGRVVDLTYKLNATIPYWPGETYTPFKYETIATLEKEGVFSGFFCMPEHVGTHINAPNHFETGQLSVDEIDLRQLIAPAIVVDVKTQASQDPDYRLTVADLKQWEKKNGAIPSGALVFMYTGWDTRWTNNAAYRNQDEQKVMHFPGFSNEAAEFLVRERTIRGIGIDTLSVDYGASKDFRVHHIVNRAGKYHIENTANLAKLPAQGAIVIIGAIPLQGGSGGPARVFALLP